MFENEGMLWAWREEGETFEKTSSAYPYLHVDWLAVSVQRNANPAAGNWLRNRLRERLERV